MSTDTATAADAATNGDDPRGATPARERKLRAQGKKTMGKLMDAATEVFAQRGYSAARVDDIVKVAKTSHGSFYLYFSNKEDLLRALLADCVQDMQALATGLDEIDSGKKGYEALREWLGTYSELYHQYWPVIHAWQEAEHQGVEFGRMGLEALGGFAGLFSEQIRKVNKKGTIDPDVASLAFIAMIERFQYFVESRQVRMDQDKVLDTLAHIAHRGIFGGRSR